MDRFYVQPAPPGSVLPYVLQPNPQRAYRRAEAGGLEPCALDDPLALVLDARTGRIVELRALPRERAPEALKWVGPAEIQAAYDRANARNDGSVVEFSDVNIKATPLMLASMATLLRVGYRTGQTPEQTATLVLRRVRLWGSGDLIGGFRVKVELYDSRGHVDDPVLRGRPPGHVIAAQEVVHCVVEHFTSSAHGRGFYLSHSNGQWLGEHVQGARLAFGFIEAWNIDGRASDGKGGRIVGGWGETHTDIQEFKDSAGATLAWFVANFLQLNGLPRSSVLVERCISLNELGKSRSEDSLSMFGGSGGTAANPARVLKCLFHVAGGWDPAYVPGVSASYDPSNRIASGEGPQFPSKTLCSSTGVLIGDGARAALEDNSSDVLVEEVIIIGARAYLSQQAGRRVTMRRCLMALCDRHFSGVRYSWSDAALQVMDYRKTRVIVDGKAVDVWGGSRFLDNQLATGAPGSAPTPIKLSKDAEKGGGKDEGNVRVARVMDGGAQLIADWYAQAHADGVRIGSSLSP